MSASSTPRQAIFTLNISQIHHDRHNTPDTHTHTHTSQARQESHFYNFFNFQINPISIGAKLILMHLEAIKQAKVSTGLRGQLRSSNEGTEAGVRE